MMLALNNLLQKGASSYNAFTTAIVFPVEVLQRSGVKCQRRKRRASTVIFSKGDHHGKPGTTFQIDLHMEPAENNLRARCGLWAHNGCIAISAGAGFHDTARLHWWRRRIRSVRRLEHGSSWEPVRHSFI